MVRMYIAAPLFGFLSYYLKFDFNGGSSLKVATYSIYLGHIIQD